MISYLMIKLIFEFCVVEINVYGDFSRFWWYKFYEMEYNKRIGVWLRLFKNFEGSI